MDRTRANAQLNNSDELAKSKDKLRQAGRSVDPLAPLRRHPGVTVATAAALGAIVASPASAQAVQTAFAVPLKRRLINYGLMQAFKLGRSLVSHSSESKPCQE